MEGRGASAVDRGRSHGPARTIAALSSRGARQPALASGDLRRDGAATRSLAAGRRAQQRDRGARRDDGREHGARPVVKLGFLALNTLALAAAGAGLWLCRGRWASLWPLYVTRWCRPSSTCCSSRSRATRSRSCRSPSCSRPTPCCGCLSRAAAPARANCLTMRVLLLDRWSGGRDGPGVYIRELAKGLLQDGHEPHLAYDRAARARDASPACETHHVPGLNSRDACGRGARRDCASWLASSGPSCRSCECLDVPWFAEALSAVRAAGLLASHPHAHLPQLDARALAQRRLCAGATFAGLRRSALLGRLRRGWRARHSRLQPASLLRRAADDAALHRVSGAEPLRGRHADPSRCRPATRLRRAVPGAAARRGSQTRRRRSGAGPTALSGAPRPREGQPGAARSVREAPSAVSVAHRGRGRRGPERSRSGVDAARAAARRALRAVPAHAAPQRPLRSLRRRGDRGRAVAVGRPVAARASRGHVAWPRRDRVRLGWRRERDRAPGDRARGAARRRRGARRRARATAARPGSCACHGTRRPPLRRVAAVAASARRAVPRWRSRTCSGSSPRDGANGPCARRRRHGLHRWAPGSRAPGARHAGRV